MGFIFGVYIAAASPLIGKVNLENSKNWIEDFVSAISNWLESNPRKRDGVLQEVIAMTQDFVQLGDLWHLHNSTRFYDGRVEDTMKLWWIQDVAGMKLTNEALLVIVLIKNKS